MFLVPYRRFHVDSAIDSGEFVRRLEMITSARQPWFHSLVGEYEFVGAISPRAFQLMPVRPGRNTYLPKVIGVLQASGERTAIDVTQTLHPIAIAAMLFFLAVTVGSALFYRDYAAAVVLLLALSIFHLLMYVTGFVPEAARVETKLRQLAG
jgi:hypothetical protein